MRYVSQERRKTCVISFVDSVASP